MLIPFPIAFLSGALVGDLVYLATGDPFWATASFWLIAAGVITGVVAALAGMTDFIGSARVRALSHAWTHFLGNAAALLLAAANLWLRSGGHAVEGALPWGLALSAVVFVILGYTGWLGGELSYRHRVGVMAAQDAPEADAASARAAERAAAGE